MFRFRTATFRFIPCCADYFKRRSGAAHLGLLIIIIAIIVALVIAGEKASKGLQGQSDSKPAKVKGQTSRILSGRKPQSVDVNTSGVEFSPEQTSRDDERARKYYPDMSKGGQP